MHCLLCRMIKDMEVTEGGYYHRNGRKTGCQSRYLRYNILPPFDYYCGINCIAECPTVFEFADAPDMIMSSEVPFHNFYRPQ